MPLFSFEGKSPRVHPTAFVAPTAVLIGDVTIEERASVWYNAVLRGDFNPIVVRRGANVQDCAVVHVTPRGGTEIGAGSTVGHNCTIHAASLGEECLVGNGATVLDGVTVGKRALVAAGCTVPPGMVIPDDMLAVGVPARIAGEVAGGAKRWVQTNPHVYRDLAKRHAAGARLISG